MNKKETKISKIIKNRINKIDPSAEIILYGSHARGEAHKESDWDILILINKPKNSRDIEDIYRDEIFEIELEYGEAISSMIFSKQDWETKYSITPLYKNVNEEGFKIN